MPKIRKRWKSAVYAMLLAMSIFLAAPGMAADADGDGPALEYTLVRSSVYSGLETVAEEDVYGCMFFNQLSPAARDIYDALLAHTEVMMDGKSQIEIQFSAGITREAFAFSDYVDAVSAFTRDHSEVFWIDFSKLTLTVYENPQTKALHATLHAPAGSYYISPYTDVQQVQGDREALTNGLADALEAVDPNADTYTQLVQIHDWICINNTYNDQIEANDMRMFEAVSALDGNSDTKPVCEGYARAFKMLCDARDIPCVLIDGAAIQYGNAVAHMWNLVYLDGNWYAVDVTWDDGALGADSRSYDYFLVGASTSVNGVPFAGSHIQNRVINSGGREFVYPVSSETSYVYSSKQEDTLLPGFEKTAIYMDGIFRDVQTGDWYRDNVALVYALGLMVGNGDGSFNADGEMRIAECISIAARIHATYTGSTAIPVSEGTAWYDTAVQYALENGILTQPCSDYTLPVTRQMFAQILSRALPKEALEAINTIPDGVIPDVAEDEEIYLLYRAGVLCGDETGNFQPDAAIRRCEAAAIITRMADPGLRIRFVL